MILFSSKLWVYAISCSIFPLSIILCVRLLGLCGSLFNSYVVFCHLNAPRWTSSYSALGHLAGAHFVSLYCMALCRQVPVLTCNPAAAPSAEPNSQVPSWPRPALSVPPVSSCEPVSCQAGFTTDCLSHHSWGATAHSLLYKIFSFST